MIVSELDSFLGFVVNLSGTAAGEVGNEIADLGEVVETLALAKLVQDFVDDGCADFVAAFCSFGGGFICSVQGSFVGKVSVQFFLNAAEPFVIRSGTADDFADEPACQVLCRLSFIAVVIQEDADGGDGIGFDQSHLVIDTVCVIEPIQQYGLICDAGVGEVLILCEVDVVVQIGSEIRLRIVISGQFQSFDNSSLIRYAVDGIAGALAVA